MSILRKEWRQRQAHHGPSSFLNRRTALLLAGALTLGIGAALNWNWLIAAGIGPIVLSLLPCAVMCVIGVCMHKGKGKTDSNMLPREGTLKLRLSRVAKPSVSAVSQPRKKHPAYPGRMLTRGIRDLTVD